MDIERPARSTGDHRPDLAGVDPDRTVQGAGQEVTVRDRAVSLIVGALAARVLGHGRRMEGYLVIAKILGALAYLFFPSASEFSTSTSDLFWLGWDRYLLLPYLVAAILSSYGFFGNIHAWPRTQQPRFWGAAIGWCIWTFLSVKLIVFGAWTASGLTLGVPAALYGELGVMFYAAANLPEPGAAGNLGAKR